MATVHVALATVKQRPQTAVSLPDSQPRLAETLSSSGTSSAGSNVAISGDIWSITALGNVWVAFGSSPTAVSGAGWLLTSGQTLERAAIAGEKCAVKDAT